jgi:hypothetical protein
MLYADASELIAELVLQPHGCCGPDCLCWELRLVPAIGEEVKKLQLLKLQADMPDI